MSLSKIQWTDATWNPVRGCSRVSEGCRNCYAERIATRLSGRGQPFHGFAGTGGPQGPPRWTGKVALIPEKLDEPLHWKKPRRIFVNSMSDLFHEALSDSDVTEVFKIMDAARRHTFQILTKRPQRMLDMMSMVGAHPGHWPLPNVWLGVSVEDQATADERIPLLLQTQAAVRFVSYEPALARVNFRRWLRPFSETSPDWIIVGGESGPGARPCDLAWVRSTVKQCREGFVPCFVKQLGAWIGVTEDWPPLSPGRLCARRWRFADGMEWAPGIIGDRNFQRPEGAVAVALNDRKGGDWSEWPEDLRVREFPK